MYICYVVLVVIVVLPYARCIFRVCRKRAYLSRTLFRNTGSVPEYLKILFLRILKSVSWQKVKLGCVLTKYMVKQRHMKIIHRLLFSKYFFLVNLLYMSQLLFAHTVQSITYVFFFIRWYYFFIKVPIVLLQLVATL